MTATIDFQAKLADIQRAMEREEWGKAINDLENIGALPDKFVGIASNVLFYLYVSRNQFEKLVRISERFDPAKSKDCVSAALLLRDKILEYPIKIPANWKIETWEQAIEAHTLADKLEPKELQLCFFFLAFLNRPRLLEMLLLRAVEAGGDLDNEASETVVRCYLNNKMYAEARRFLWINNLNNIAFDRFDFLIDRAEKGATTIPESKDKFLTFLRHKFGAEFSQQA